MLTVMDLSNHQTGMTLSTLRADAFIFKATEGTSFIDHACDPFVQQAIALKKPFGVYHFMDKSDVIEQARFFVKHIEGYLGEALLVLDYEAYGKQGPAQAKRFLDEVYRFTRIKPLIYMNESDANEVDWKDVIQANYGLWVAKYSKNEPILSQWPQIAMWQFTSTPLDTSYFYGDLTAWKAYSTPDKTHKEYYHTSGKRFKALKDLIVKADSTWQKNTGMTFCQGSIIDIDEILHTKTTTHARILYNHCEVFVTLHQDHVERIS